MNPIKNKAIALLARREHTYGELERKLKQRGFALSDIHPILDELKNENLLSEVRFIGSFIRTKRSKGYGPLKIYAQLQQRGIERCFILEHEEWQQAAWHESAITVRIKRFGETPPKERQERSQQARFLQQRGFTQDQIHVALKER